ncbi:ABC transporter ATP-binding protein [Pigmentiphaga soli]|uniref:ABC transporter ATP-binding protein n=1 Tax=Pigmentiphaga soli TaxID=1007095 RepID=A0ABP8HCH7_9BURK
MDESQARNDALRAAAPAAIVIDGVARQFNSRGQSVTALDNVNLQIGDGEFVSFLGPSGCGKSTLFMIVAGLLAPSRGEVRIAGRRVDRPVTDIGIVFQQDLLVDWRTVLENVLLQAEVRRLPLAPARERARQLLQQVGLAGFENRRPWELSGGMRQRAAICRALLHDARILMMDEPFGALDALTRDQMNLDLQALWSQTRRTAILVTHSISEAIFLSDRVVVMSPRPGRVILDLRIDLPRPRTIEMRDSAEFVAYQKQLRGMIGAH